MMAAILAFIKGIVSKTESDLSTLAGRVSNVEKLTKGNGLTNGNIDEMLTTGIGWVQSQKSTGTMPGYSYFALLILETNNNGIVTQIAINMSGGMKSRVYANNAWGSWE